MCGIAGILSKVAVSNRTVLDEMRDTMVHRGPDSAGTWWSSDGTVGLAHRRLSILDLTSTGHQPMVSADGRYSITFNGEIYNHEELRSELKKEGCCFHSRSDTEVLLYAWIHWGDKCLERLRGIFAFAAIDTLKGKALLARDRAGEKPLFWGRFGDRFIFASELKAIFADTSIPRRINLFALDCYLAYGYVPQSLCLVSGMNKLAPGSAISINWRAGDFSISNYWSLPPPIPETRPIDPSQLVSELDGLLESAVKEQLCADVPVGILLSGGVDSSIITAMARRVHSGRLHTFTLGIPGHPSFDERHIARSVANAFSTEHTEVEADHLSLKLLPELVRQFDEPVCDSSMIPTLMLSRLVRKHCTVALGGDGGDELFGGYNNYRGVWFRESLRPRIPKYVRGVASRTAEKLMPIGMSKRNGIMALAGEPADGIARDGTFFTPSERAKLCPMLLAAGAVGTAEALKKSLVDVERGVPGAAMATDFRAYLPDDILVKVDRSSMLPSLEIRAPFLDWRIVEFAFSRVPNSLRVDKNRKKILLYKLLEKVLPGINAPYKQGFSVPLSEWIDAGYVQKHILEHTSKKIFDASHLERLTRHLSQHPNNSERLFCLVVLLAWLAEYEISF